jgi:hypothetical protein
MSKRSIGLILLVGGILAVPVVAWVYPHPVAEVATPDTQAVPVMQSTSESSPVVEGAPPDEFTAEGMDPSCIWGVSKNLCDGRLYGGKWDIVKCGECVNLVGLESKLEVRMLHNPDPCCDLSTTPCDEAEKLYGVLVGKGEYHIRLNKPCPIRGWWQTPWDVYTQTGTKPIASGWLDGTLGTGTHRVPKCPDITPEYRRCGDKCETCYMAEFDASVKPGRWIIHVEGSMVGKTVNECQVRVTMQGFFVAPADKEGMPIPPNELEKGWTFCGTVDGVLDCPCK